MDSISRKPAVDAEPARRVPGEGNGLKHVRGLFQSRYPDPFPWPKGFLTKLANERGVEPDVVHRVFRTNPGWTTIPREKVIEDLANALEVPNCLVVFAFMADLYPATCDEVMYRTLERVAQMHPAQLKAMGGSARRATRPAPRR
ncbi:hypothetical protein [Amycolatopsis sp. NPDC004079]|uniref:hypothetical protein n=1 Tax=Amycolatopsis sp. NPDC004079 TaxID=3154549 RepID=UPI0033B07C4B